MHTPPESCTLRAFSTQLGRVLIIAAAALAFKAGAQELPRSVLQALRSAGVPASSVSAWVQEVGAVRPSVAARADRAVQPGSVMKLVTTYAALELLGRAYRWKTEAYVDGDDLVLRGYGDPNLNYESFWLLLRNLRGRGLKDLRGDVVLDRSYFGPAQYSAFDSEVFRPYNVTPDALLVNFKSLRFTFIPDGDKGVRIFAEPALPGLQIVNSLKLGDGACPDGNRAFRELMQASFESRPPRASFVGVYPMSCGERDLNIALYDAQDYLAAMIRQLWGEMGGTWSGTVREGTVSPSAKLIYVHESDPLSDIVRDINKFSNNVMARQLFLTVGAQLGGPPARAEEAARAIKDWVKGKKIDAPELELENGSGLSHNERISARHLAELLLAAWRSPVMAEFLSSLPVVATDGTMRKRLLGQRIAGSAHIKTGLLADTRSIAGYVLDRNGRRHVVVMIANHPKAPQADAAMDALLQWVYDSPTAPARAITNRPGASRPRP
jgi:D-alanyl-D-alanine carboxypeptidase/D-alanyl-D-alanine-endopeptidase (penicillin-binding protein 4)